MTRRHDLKINVIDFLGALKVRNIGSGEEEVQFSCPFPGHKHGDQTPSARMNAFTTAWICHSCHRRGNALTFLSDLEGVSIAKAQQWLREEWGAAFREPAGGMASELEYLLKEPQERKERKRNVKVYESWVDTWIVDWSQPGPAKYMLDRGFDIPTMKHFQIGLYKDRIAIPVRDETGMLVGFKARAIDPNTQPRYLALGTPAGKGLYPDMPFPTYQASDVVFGAHEVKPEDGMVILCEGELNAIRMWQYGYRNVVAISGSSISKEQVSIITNIAESVTLYFDDDKAGIDGHERAERMFDLLLPVFSIPAHDKDAADSTQEEVDELINRRKSTLLNFISLHTDERASNA